LGTIIAQGLKRALRLSGRDALPAYPGFIVILTVHVDIIVMPSSSSKVKVLTLALIAV
jgi:hypothetical protein